MIKDQKILQIIPAIGWFAVFKADDGSLMYEDIVCWALIEEDSGEFAVTGMSCYGDYVDFCENTANFHSYRTEPAA